MVNLLYYLQTTYVLWANALRGMGVDIKRVGRGVELVYMGRERHLINFYNKLCV